MHRFENSYTCVRKVQHLSLWYFLTVSLTKVIDSLNAAATALFKRIFLNLVTVVVAFLVWRLPSLSRVRWEGEQIANIVANVTISQRCHAKHPLSQTWTKVAIHEVTVDICKSIDSIDTNWASRLVLDYQWGLGAERNVVKSVEYTLIGVDW